MALTGKPDKSTSLLASVELLSASLGIVPSQRDIAYRNQIRDQIREKGVTGLANPLSSFGAGTDLTRLCEYALLCLKDKRS